MKYIQTRSSHERLIMLICHEYNRLFTSAPLTCGLVTSRMTQMRTVLLTGGLCVPAWRYWGKAQKKSVRIVGLRPYTDSSKMFAFYKAYSWWWRYWDVHGGAVLLHTPIHMYIQACYVSDLWWWWWWTQIKPCMEFYYTYITSHISYKHFVYTHTHTHTHTYIYIYMTKM